MILMYHHIHDEVGFNTVSSGNFEDHIRYLISDSRFRVVSVSEYIEGLGYPSDKQIIALTFDDAYDSISSRVLPVIKKYDVPVTVFVPANMVGGWNSWDTAKGYKELKILTWSGIKSLNNEKLVTFGSHGLNHISLGNVDRETFLNEIALSREKLEKELNCPVEYFSFPYGQLKDINEKYLYLLQECGYKAAFSTIWNRKNTRKNVFTLNRIEIKGSDDIESFQKIVNRKIDIKYYKQTLKNVLFRLNLYT